MLIRKVLRDLRINATQFIAIFVMTLFAMLVVSGFDSSDGSALILDKVNEIANEIRLKGGL